MQTRFDGHSVLRKYPKDHTLCRQLALFLSSKPVICWHFRAWEGMEERYWLQAAPSVSASLALSSHLRFAEKRVASSLQFSTSEFPSQFCPQSSIAPLELGVSLSPAQVSFSSSLCQWGLRSFCWHLTARLDFLSAQICFDYGLKSFAIALPTVRYVLKEYKINHELKFLVLSYHSFAVWRSFRW